MNWFGSGTNPDSSLSEFNQSSTTFHKDDDVKLETVVHSCGENHPSTIDSGKFTLFHLVVPSINLQLTSL